MDPSELPLRDLHLPEAVAWWPLAPGWWMLIVFAVIGAGWIALRAMQRWNFNAPQRYAIKELDRVEAEYLEHRNTVTLGRDISQLLRRAMLAYAPRGEVAGLVGERWLQWLDSGMQVPYFHTKGGKSLLELPYRDPQSDLSDSDINALLAAAKMRLSTPMGGQH